MIDGCKFSVYGEAKDNLLQNPLLRLSETTYNGLHFKMNPDPQGCYVRGSLHRYKNNGEHNADDFTLSEFNSTLERMSKELDLNPEILVFSNVEFGLNIQLPFDVQRFLQSIVMYCGEATKNIIREPNGIRIELSEYIVKLYDKHKKYPKHAEENMMRFEVNITRTRRIRERLLDDNTTVVRTLSDLANPKVWRCFGRELMRVYEGLVVYDVDVAELRADNKITDLDAKILSEGKGIGYWEKIPKTTKKRHLERFTDLISEHSEMKNEVRKLLCEKIENVTSSQKSGTTSQKSGTTSQKSGTTSHVFESADIHGSYKSSGTTSHVDKVGCSSIDPDKISIENHPKDESKKMVSVKEKKMREYKLKSELLCEVRQYFNKTIGSERAWVRNMDMYLTERFSDDEYVDKPTYDAIILYMTNKEVTTRIHELCLETGITTRELSERTGLYLPVIERTAGMGHTCRNRQSVKTLMAISDGLNVGFYDLFYTSTANNKKSGKAAYMAHSLN